MPLRRPLATAVLLYFAALVCAAFLASALNLTLFVMVTVLGLVAIFIQRESHSVILLCVLPVALGFLVMWHQQIRTQTVADALGTQTCMISGEITDIPRQQYGRWYYTVQTSSIDLPEVPQSLRLRLFSRTSLNAAEGDQVTVAVTFLEDTVSNSSHSRTNLLADGIAARAWCLPSAEPTVTAADAFSRIRFFPLTVRRSIIAAMKATLPSKSAGMLCAMLLGDTDALDQSVVRHFRTSGIGHLLAVSGLHVSLLAAVCTRMTFRLRWRPRQSYLLTMGVILLFMAVTGFTPSVTRAGIMHLMALTAQLFHRNPDPLTSLSLSLLIMLLVRPMIATDIGLQLSVVSTVGIILFADRLKSRLTHRFHRNPSDRSSTLRKKIKAGFIDNFSVSVTAALVTMPLSAMYFGYLSLTAPLTNLLCLSPAMLFLLTGITAGLLHAVPIAGIALSFPFRLAAAALAQYLDSVTALLSGIPLGCANASYPYVPFFFAFSGGILLAVFLLIRRDPSPDRHRYAASAAFCAISLLLSSAMISHKALHTGARIHIFATEGGACVCARSGVRTMITQTGGERLELSAIQSCLDAEGVRTLDALAVACPDGYHSGLGDALIETYAPHYCFCGDSADSLSRFPVIGKAAGRSHTRLLPLGGTVKLPALTLEMFTDRQGAQWQRFTAGATSVLVCPDNGDCALLPPGYLTCDVLILRTPPTHITYLSAGAVILTGEPDEISLTASRLRVKGFRHLYPASSGDSFTCEVIDGNLHIQVNR